ncbi:halo-CC-star protein HcsL [Natronococcus sp. A-GB7]|uniref:halo-CC-star protein HcsL n=1 Tax=Natronococcus sp. A-GB7 TaxID=3037649 RepID=UPI00241C70EE|nr:halo-CC-star protein HcsL [Natronococcus sp. A-GB7]MDG5820806.1 halo-CC-star protein HcsL [Natronococcus sp. A-GB7]
MSEAVSEGEAVEESLQAFIETLCDSETYQQFVDASEQLEADDDAQSLLEAYQQKQQQLQGEKFDSSVMSELQELQTEISDNETIQQHRTAQEELVVLLEQTNDVISEQIRQEFAQSLGGGCC